MGTGSGPPGRFRHPPALLTLKAGLAIGAGLLAVAAVAGAFLAVRGFRDDDDAVARARAVATTAGMPTASPILRPTSFMLTQTNWSYGRIPGEDRLGEITSTVQVWYRKPGQWRFEGSQVQPPGPATSVVMVLSNAVAWTWTSITDVVQENPATVPEPGDSTQGKAGDWNPYGASDLDTLLGAWRSCYSPVPLGEETVAGRAAWAFDLGATRCPSASASDFNGPARIWVDRETLFTLKYLVLAPDGTVAMLREVTSIAYDVTLPDGLFEPLVNGQTPTLHP